VSKRAVAFVSDLLFASNIEATLGRAGYEVVSVEDLPALEQALAAGPAGLVILDLHAGAAAKEVVQRAKGVPVLAFGRHTAAALLRAARAAGCARVVPRSTFVAEMSALVTELRQIGGTADQDEEESLT